ncbi:lipase [Planotetraspora silvatica]|uniref:Lipase n=1 Tax=Planotetraspora silvatica TaxID=234614 RepID=A0A8J3XRJ0_9ACTN|nr:SGNH/GDSL hydrolase family protein [Planotetraspora silvatica]GII50255.1 lipase [Planotetraspora silvatica]
MKTTIIPLHPRASAWRRLAAVVFGVALGAALITAPAGAASTSTPSALYVALGDSYTSGYGLPTQLTSPAIIAGCGQSSSNYPKLVAAHYGIAVDDRSCAGATTAAFTNWQGANPPQTSALGPNTVLVTIGMGGNDVGSSTITTSCLQAGAANHSCQTPQLNNLINTSLANLAAHLPGDIAHIKSLAPNATIVYVSYLTGLPSQSTWTATGCSSNLPYYSGDITWLNNFGQRLNNTLRTAAQSQGAIFVDALNMSAGHDPCRPVGTRWNEGIHPAAPATATFHPNLAGHSAYASMIISALGG